MVVGPMSFMELIYLLRAQARGASLLVSAARWCRKVLVKFPWARRFRCNCFRPGLPQLSPGNGQKVSKKGLPLLDQCPKLQKPDNSLSPARRGRWTEDRLKTNKHEQKEHLRSQGPPLGLTLHAPAEASRVWRGQCGMSVAAAHPELLTVLH